MHDNQNQSERHSLYTRRILSPFNSPFCRAPIDCCNTRRRSSQSIRAFARLPRDANPQCDRSPSRKAKVRMTSTGNCQGAFWRSPIRESRRVMKWVFTSSCGRGTKIGTILMHACDSSILKPRRRDCGARAVPLTNWVNPITWTAKFRLFQKLSQQH